MLNPFFNTGLDNYYDYGYNGPHGCNCCRNPYNNYNTFYRPRNQELDFFGWNGNPYRDRVFSDVDFFRPARLVNFDDSLRRLRDIERSWFNDDFFKKAHNENKDHKNFCQSVFKTTRLHDGKQVSRVEKTYRNSEGQHITEVTDIDQDGNKSIKILKGDQKDKKMVLDQNDKPDDGPEITDAKDENTK